MDIKKTKELLKKRGVAISTIYFVNNGDNNNGTLEEMSFK